MFKRELPHEKTSRVTTNQHVNARENSNGESRCGAPILRAT